MTPRAIRRAAERTAAKLAHKAQPNQPVAASTTTPAQIAANQANSQLSCGPKSETGKQISSKNALKTGLTGRTVLLPTDDQTAYESLLNTFLAKLTPATEDERELTQIMVDCTWRMRRIVSLEFAIYAKGALDFDGEYQDLEPAVRAQIIQAETHLKYEKSIRSLNSQEARLRRLLEKTAKDLEAMQNERLQREVAVEAIRAAHRQNSSTETDRPPSQPEIGFVFSNSELTPEFESAVY